MLVCAKKFENATFLLKKVKHIHLIFGHFFTAFFRVHPRKLGMMYSKWIATDHTRSMVVTRKSDDLVSMIDKIANEDRVPTLQEWRAITKTTRLTREEYESCGGKPGARKLYKLSRQLKYFLATQTESLRDARKLTFVDYKRFSKDLVLAKSNDDGGEVQEPSELPGVWRRAE